jgi:phosphoesterase RecJ-like protein
MFTVPDPVKDFIRRYSRFLILGHLDPDGDCVASQLALALFLKRTGRETLLLSAGPFDRPEIAPYTEFFQSRLDPADQAADGAGTAAVVLDCSSPERVGALYESVSSLPLLVIDHHASGEEFGSERWVESEAPAVTFMVQLLIEALGEKPNRQEARLLLFGLCTDTGFFRHLDKHCPRVFAAVARLTAAGASPREAYRMIYSGGGLEKLKLLARTLLRAEPCLGGRVIVTCQTLKDFRSPGGEAVQGSDDLYRLLQNVHGAELVALIREEEGDRCTVGLRTSDSFDAGVFAKSCGGGGHARAAGYPEDGSVAEVRKRLIDRLRKLQPWA